MAGDKKVNLASTVRNASDPFSIRTQNKDFGVHPFSSSEADLFESQFNTFLNDIDSRIVTDILIQREDEIALAAAYAKNQFDEKLFGGINAADNEIGFDILRPGHIRADPADGEVQNDWFYEHTDGWNDWIGDGTSDNDYSIDEDQVVVVLGVVDSGVLIVEEEDGTINTFERENYTATSGINVDRFGRNVDMLPKDMNSGKIPDNDNSLLTQSIPTMIGADRDRVHLRLRSDVPAALEDANASVYSEPRLVGVTFGVGSYMNQEDF